MSTYVERLKKQITEQSLESLKENQDKASGPDLENEDNLTWKEKFSEVAKTLESTKKQLHERKKENKDLKDKLKRLTAELQAVSTERESQQNLLLESETLKKSLQKKVLKLVQSNKTLKQNISELNSTNEKLQFEKKTLAQKIQDQTQSHTSAIATLESEISRIKKILAEKLLELETHSNLSQIPITTPVEKFTLDPQTIKKISQKIIDKTSLHPDLCLKDEELFLLAKNFSGDIPSFAKLIAQATWESIIKTMIVKIQEGVFKEEWLPSLALLSKVVNPLYERNDPILAEVISNFLKGNKPLLKSRPKNITIFLIQHPALLQHLWSLAPVYNVQQAWTQDLNWIASAILSGIFTYFDEISPNFTFNTLFESALTAHDPESKKLFAQIYISDSGMKKQIDQMLSQENFVSKHEKDIFAFKEFIKTGQRPSIGGLRPKIKQIFKKEL